MNPNDRVNKGQTPRSVPIACRYPEDCIGLLDAVQKRLGLGSRSELMRHALDQIVEAYFPGAIRPDPAPYSETRATEDTR